MRRARQHAAARQRRVIRRPGQTEIRDDRPLRPLGQQHIRRLHIAVDQPLCVGRLQSPGHLQPDRQRRFQVQLPVPVQPLLQRGIGQIRHHQIRQFLVLRNLVDRDHMVMDHRRGGPSLPCETPSRRGR